MCDLPAMSDVTNRREADEFPCATVTMETVVTHNEYKKK